MVDTFNFPVLQRRKGQILLSGLVVSAIALGVSHVIPKQYTANGGMIVENAELNVPELGIGGVAGTADLNDSLVLTQLDVLRSRGLIARVVDDLHLANAPGLVPASRLPMPILGVVNILSDYFTAARDYIAPPDLTDVNRDDTPVNRTIAFVQKYLKVTATEHSNVISLQFTAGSPSVASAVVDAVMGTYLSNDIWRRGQETTQVNNWLTEQTALLHKQADDAQRRVEAFVNGNSLPEVQGSLTAAVQLSKDKDFLATARQDLATKQAILDSMRGGAGQTQQALDSRAIQIYQERASQILQTRRSYTGGVTSDDAALNSTRAAIGAETDKIAIAARHNVEVAQATVKYLETAVKNDEAQAQTASVGSVTLANLKADATAKQAIWVAFGSRVEQTRLAAARLPAARILFPAAPIPNHSFALLALLLGFLGGMFSAIAYYVLRESLSTKITSTAKMSLMTGLPVFGSLPEVPRSARRDTLLLQAPVKTSALFDETLRGIWLTLRSNVDTLKGGTSVIVTSSGVGEGKTMVATTLARRIAADGYRVLLIDADLRRPRLGSIFKLRPQHFLETVLNSAVTMNDAIVHDSLFGVDCLLTEGTSKNPMRLLSSDTVKALLAEAKIAYDFIVLDSPPVLQVTDSVILARLCQHILFIVAAGHVSGEIVGKAVNRFGEADRSKIITLLTRVQPGYLDRSDYFGGYEHIKYDDAA